MATYTKKHFEDLKEKLDSLKTPSEQSMNTLLSITNEIGELIKYIVSKIPKGENTFEGSQMQFVESKLYLEAWFKTSKKRTLVSTFSEYRYDMLSILDDFIKLGDRHALWES